ncbi:MAG TPA: TraR/DksA C4-type zinc finger protein [Thermoleophilaceae bacterium]|jgi:RNA polymerase-binding transcription factor DksA
MPDYDRQDVEARLDERMREIEERRAGVRRGSEGMRDELADYDQHPADQGTETFEQELDETTLMMLDDEENRVKAARRALEDGTYGVCADCGKEIPAARLKAMPESIRCVEDQRLHEARLRQGGGPAASPG